MLALWRDMNRMVNHLDYLRNSLEGFPGEFDTPRSMGNLWVTDAMPKTNLYDQGDSFEIMAEVPGLEKDDITIRVQGNYLEISGEKKNDTPEGYKAHRVERTSASFSRSFTLPADVDAEKVVAKLRDGILTVTLPRAEAAKPRKIAIEA